MGTCKTFGTGHFSHKLVSASCAFSGSNKPIFDHIREEGGDIFVHMGDLHYDDIDANVTGSHYKSFQTVFNCPRQAALFRSVALAYMWDDHDYTGNNADGFATGRVASRSAYTATVPHYPLMTPTVNGPIYQAFTVGRVRYIVTDLRCLLVFYFVFSGVAKT